MSEPLGVVRYDGKADCEVESDIEVYDVSAQRALAPLTEAPTYPMSITLSDKAQAVLAKYQTVPDDMIEIRPDGNIYVPHMKYRQILNEAFGFGGWAMRPVPGSTVQVAENGNHVTLYREYEFWCEGQYQRTAMGAGDYYKNNPKTNYSDAAEICESNALARVCKKFALAAQCWDRAYAEQWTAKYAMRKGSDWVKKPSNKLDAASASPTLTHAMGKTSAPAAEAPPAPTTTASAGAASNEVRVLYPQGVVLKTPTDTRKRPYWSVEFLDINNNQVTGFTRDEEAKDLIETARALRKPVNVRFGDKHEIAEVTK